MRKRLLLLVILLFGQTLFAQKVMVQTDKFSGNKWVMVNCGTVSKFSEELMLHQWVRVNFYAHPSNPPEYALNLEFEQPDWLFIEPGSALTIKLDGELIELSGPGSANTRSTNIGAQGAYITESADFSISYKLLQRIAKATTDIEFRVVGKNGSYTGKFKPSVIKGAANLVAMIPDGPWTIKESAIIKITDPRAVDAAAAANKTPADPAATNPTLPDLKQSGSSYKAGIRFNPSQNGLQILMVDPKSDNLPLLGKLIVAIEGKHAVGSELQGILTSTIAAHQDGSPIRITVIDSPGSTELETILKLYKP